MSSGDFSIGSKVWPGTSKLIEEMGELNQVLGKLIAVHGNRKHWDGDLLVKLIEELADVEAAIGFFLRVNLNTDQCVAVRARAEQKERLFWQWHSEGDPPP